MPCVKNLLVPGSGSESWCHHLMWNAMWHHLICTIHCSVRHVRPATKNSIPAADWVIFTPLWPLRSYDPCTHRRIRREEGKALWPDAKSKSVTSGLALKYIFLYGWAPRDLTRATWTNKNIHSLHPLRSHSSKQGPHNLQKDHSRRGKLHQR